MSTNTAAIEVMDDPRLVHGSFPWHKQGAGRADNLPRILRGNWPDPVARIPPREARDELLCFGEELGLTLRMAVTEEDRLKAWHLAYEEYLACGYTQPSEVERRYSLHDALPETGTFLVEDHGTLVGTITAFPDSPLGLPADEIYLAEIDAVRQAGRRLAEIGRLTIRSEYAKHRKILLKILEVPFLYARGVLGATDVVITVNPKHESFYRRMMLFDLAAGERELASVCGAPGRIASDLMVLW